MLYLRITKPVRRPPNALPITDGIRWAPAFVTDACADTWKYNGTRSIICDQISRILKYLLTNSQLPERQSEKRD